MLSIGDAATMLGVCKKTVRRWENRNIITSIRTPGNHRRYNMKDIRNLLITKEPDINPDRKKQKNTIIYARVSGHKQKQKGDLDRQVVSLSDYCKNQNFPNIITITDVGSGLNEERKGIKKLFRMIQKGSVGQIIVTFKDRLTRFGFGFIERYCALFNVPIITVKTGSSSSI